MHRTLKQEVRTAENWRAQQRELDRFRREYNEVRAARGAPDADAGQRV